MTDTTLSIWGNGAITLPKEWRERYETKHFMVKENSNGYLVIMPILDVEYYEENNGVCGIRFPTGIDPEELAKKWCKTMNNIEKEETKINKKKTKRKKSSSGYMK